MKNKKWYKSKTIWGGISGFISAVAGFMTGAMDPGTAVVMGFTAIQSISLRDAIK